jgi:hypothetical protein
LKKAEVNNVPDKDYIIIPEFGLISGQEIVTLEKAEIH